MQKSECETEVKFEFPLEKFPRLESVSKQINAMRDMVVLLNKRKELIERLINPPTSEQDTLILFEVNEKKILLNKTDMELARVHTSIIKKQGDVDDYIEKVIKPAMKTIDEDYDKILEKCKLQAKKDKIMAKALADTKFELFDENWEHKFNFYIAVKKYLKPSMRLSK